MTEAAIPSPSQRLAELDVLRGFALLGIALVNVPQFASGHEMLGLPDPRFAGATHQWVRALVALLFETKFYLLFSFLFGYSFTLQMKGDDSALQRRRFGRRLLGLALLGAAHALLLYHGDILLTYALLGIVLWRLRALAPQRAVTAGVALIALTVGLWLALAMLATLAGPDPGVQALYDQALQAEAALRAGGRAAIAQRWHELTQNVWWLMLLLQGPCVMAMFLFGLAAGRTGWVPAMAAQPARLRRTVLVGLCIGLPGSLLYAHWGEAGPGDARVLWALAADLATAPFLSAAYAALLLLALRGPARDGLHAYLGSAGRMALSNYLLQSLVFMLVFTGNGLGWIGQRTPPQVMALALLVFALQLHASRWWLRRHAYGPAEWLLRALTLAQRPAWRRAD